MQLKIACSHRLSAEIEFFGTRHKKVGYDCTVLVNESREKKLGKSLVSGDSHRRNVGKDHFLSSDVLKHFHPDNLLNVRYHDNHRIKMM